MFSLARVKELSKAQRQLLALKLQSEEEENTGHQTAKLTACIKERTSGSSDIEDIKQFAKIHLPKQFLPQVFISVEDFPRLQNGKIDRNQLSGFPFKQASKPTIGENVAELDGYEDDFDGLSFVAPTNETEQILADIWSEVLGVGEISIHDNFLEVGGDSLLSIRILARIHKAGLSIATEDFFEYPTIAEQASVVSQTIKHSYQQGSTNGTFNLIPIQHWFFERISVDPHHWNQSVLLAVDDALDYTSLERALQKVLVQHDVLRSIFKQNQDGVWVQELRPLSVELPLQYVDLRNLKASEINTAIEQHAQDVNAGLVLTKGSLITLRFFMTQKGELNRLFITAHHLLMDAESWRILLEDLNNCWVDFSRGMNTSLATKTSSFKLWSEKLTEYAASPQLQHELSYWQQQSSATPLNIPQNFSAPLSDNTNHSTKVLSTSLNHSETSTLLHTLSVRHKIEPRDALICSLVRTFKDWTNSDFLLLDIEGHGREALFEEVDISRTIGWFTTVFPVLFETNSDAKLIDVLTSVKEQLRRIPRNGIGYGVLRELTNDSPLKLRPNSQICFNYLGQIDKLASLTASNNLEIKQVNIGHVRSAKGSRAYLIEINARIENVQLQVDWSYSDKFHQPETMEKLVQNFTLHLRELLSVEPNHTSDGTNEALQTTNFELAELDQNELDVISAMLMDVDESQ